MIMAAGDHLFEFFIQAQEKYKNKYNAFEEHFAWLEEALLAAKQSFAHTETILLPKTPAKKRGRQKKIISSVTLEDGESPSKRSSIESTKIQDEVECTKIQDEVESPEFPTQRRGRAASRLAQERVAKTYKDINKRKLRRPSTPVDNSRTARKTKPTKQVEKSRDSVEIVGYVSEDNTKTVVFESQSPETSRKSQESSLLTDTLDSQKPMQQETPKKLSSSNRRSSSIGKRLKYSQSSEEETQAGKVDSENQGIHLTTNEKEKTVIEECSEMCTDIVKECKGCKMEKESNNKQKSTSHSCMVNQDSGIEECHEEQSSKKQSITKVPDCSQSKDDDAEAITRIVNASKELETTEIDNKKESVYAQPEPIPKARSTRTKQKEVVVLSSCNEQSQISEYCSSPHPIPKPRTTRTKQRLESQVSSSAGESETEMIAPLDPQKSTSVSEEEDSKQSDADLLPPPEVPKPRSTRTKRKHDDSATTEALEVTKGVCRTKNHLANELTESETITEEDNTSQCSTDSFQAPEAPKARSTRTKKKQAADINVISEALEVTKDVCRTKNPLANELTESETISEDDNTSQCSTESFLAPEVPKVRSTRTKKKQADDNDVISDAVISEAPKPRSTRTKKKVDEEVIIESSKDVPSQSDNEMPDDTGLPHSRSTRTKKRQVEDQVNQPSRSTRTKRRKMEEEDNKENTEDVVPNSDEELKSISSPKSKAVNLIRKYGISSEISSLVSEKSAVGATTENNAVTKTGHRMTRSKIRQVPVSKVSPKKASPYLAKTFGSPGMKQDFQRDCCSPKSDNGTPKNRQQMVSRVASPLRSSPRHYNREKAVWPGSTNRAPFQKGDIPSEVEEVPLNDIEVTRSPARITRHSGGKAVKRESSTIRCARLSLKRAKKVALAIKACKLDFQYYETPDSKWARINPHPRTPSPQCPAEKVIRPKMGHVLSGSSSYGSSGRITPKTYARIRPGLMHSASSSSTEYHKTQKKMNTPNDVKRTKNIVNNVTSFIRVQAPKPSREELEEKKQMDLQKKREREEETRQKKKELLKSKVEDQKRRNEERMKRAKEAREENERKVEEARKQREERFKEEQQKKKQMLAKKQAEEEAKARKIKEQMEEERRRLEEIKQAKLEEERLAEEQRLQEDKRKRIAEVERIARERKELEELKKREAERLVAAKKAKLDALTAQKAAENKTTAMKAAHNSTFTKGSVENKENSSNHNATFTKPTEETHRNTNSYELTPDKKKKTKKPAANNYNIDDIKSDDSTDDDAAPKKTIPTWAQGNQLKASLINQEYYPPNINGIFSPDELLTMPDLTAIFPIARRRFFKRTSSAIWTTPPHKLIE